MQLSTSSPPPGAIPIRVSPGASWRYTPGLIEAGHPLRERVERFIAGRFLAVHGARVSSFMPILVALFGDKGEILAALGIRSAASESLFLEHYLDIPIECSIALNAGAAPASPPRAGIVEIGNLASVDRRASRRLFKFLAEFLHAQKFDWAVFTGCSSLHSMFGSLGIETIDLGRALQSRLPSDQQTWGGYYEDNPRVVAGKVSRGRLAFDNTEAEAARSAAA